MKYIVTVSETWTKVFRVEAASQQRAEELVWEIQEEQDGESCELEDERPESPEVVDVTQE